MSSNGKSTFGLDHNLACALTYLTFVAGIVFLVSEKEDKEVRFHALQSIIFGIAYIIITFLLGFLHISLLTNILYIAYVVITVLLIFFTYQGKTIELPIIGPIAKKSA